MPRNFFKYAIASFIVIALILGFIADVLDSQEFLRQASENLLGLLGFQETPIWLVIFVIIIGLLIIAGYVVLIGRLSEDEPDNNHSSNNAENTPPSSPPHEQQPSRTVPRANVNLPTKETSIKAQKPLTLDKLLTLSGQVNTLESKMALCQRIGLDPTTLQFLKASPRDFSTLLVHHLESIGATHILSKLCDELLEYYPEGLHRTNLLSIKAKFQN